MNEGQTELVKYSKTPYPVGGGAMFRDPQWMPETQDGT